MLVAQYGYNWELITEKIKPGFDPKLIEQKAISLNLVKEQPSWSQEQYDRLIRAFKD